MVGEGKGVLAVGAGAVELAGALGGAALTVVLTGVAVALAVLTGGEGGSKRFQVSPPTTPSGFRPADRWNADTASAVLC